MEIRIFEPRHHCDKARHGHGKKLRSYVPTQHLDIADVILAILDQVDNPTPEFLEYDDFLRDLTHYELLLVGSNAFRIYQTLQENLLYAVEYTISVVKCYQSSKVVDRVSPVVRMPVDKFTTRRAKCCATSRLHLRI